MSDEEISNLYNSKWCDYRDKYVNGFYIDFVKTIPTNDLIQDLRFSKQTHVDEEWVMDEYNELKSRDIPDEMKLEVLLLIGDCND